MGCPDHHGRGECFLVAVAIGLVRTSLGYVDVSGLFVGQFGKLGIQLLQLQARNLFIEVLGQHINANRILVGTLHRFAPQLDLGDGLVGEGRGHHVGRMAGATAEIHQTALGQQDDPLAVREDDVVDLRLDLFPLVLLDRGDVDFVVEVADVADDGVVLHRRHVVMGDDVEVAGRRDEDVGLVGGVFHGDDAVAFHRGLQGADRVDFGDPDLGRQGAHGLGGALADVAVAGDDGDLAGDHHVGGALDAVDQRFAAAVEVVELGLGHRVIDVDARELEFAALMHLVQAMDAGGGFLGDALDSGQAHGIPGRIDSNLGLDGGEEDCFFFRARLGNNRDVLLGTGAQVQQQGGIAAVVEDHVRVAAVSPFENAVGVIPVIDQGFALDGEDGNIDARQWRQQRDPGSRKYCTRPSGLRRRAR
jgi:hypothetical protein